ncbi:hypothetical protein OOT46_11385 [Aquabacterium sp. A7-Y]|uniref:hypothetical protein n=1 Tax=Aquabacterium sp. A7-Y TaxID=1349605 RepID=UPI00223CA4D2|nr:hypothetical protein [Aquabacterium sp. A7-Y]MCW7538442.1 hypothetical protein [Aquabacterium sp. A7-Y]
MQTTALVGTGLAACLLLAPVPPVHAAMAYHAMPLFSPNSYPGRYEFWPEALNGKGDVVGTVQGTSLGYNAALYSKGRWQDLGVVARDFHSMAVDINDRGQVTGWAHPGLGAGIPYTHAFLYEDGRMQDLGSVGETASEATALNEKGEVTGHVTTYFSGRNAQEFFLYRQGRMTKLGHGRAYDINESGQITGQAPSRAQRGQQHAFIYSDGRTQDLGALDGDYSTGHSINDSGQVTGAFGTEGESGRAFLYSDGRMQDLGPLVGDRSSGTAINNHGDIVGWSEQGSFLFTNGVVHRLESLIDPAVLAEWRTLRPLDINDAGQILMEGSTLSRQGALLLTRAEPAPGILLGAGLGMLGLLAARSSRRQAPELLGERPFARRARHARRGVQHPTL